MSLNGFPRVRTKGAFAPIDPRVVWKLWHDCSNTNWAIVATQPNSFRHGSYQTMNDTVIPDFKRRVLKGETFFNDLSSVKRDNLLVVPGNGVHIRSTATPGICSGTPRYAETRCDGPSFPYRLCNDLLPPSNDGLLPYFPSLSDTDIRDLLAEVSTKCLANVRSPDSNLYESIAEIRQTLALLRRPFASLNRLLSREERLRGTGASAAGAWLTARYGILPVVRDVSSILGGLKKKIGNVRRTSRATGQIGQNSIVTSSMVNENGSTVFYAKQNSDSLTVRAMSLDEYAVSLYENIGFSDKGLLTLPWELIPYSFVVDWFVNVGDFLKALAPLPGVNQLGSALVAIRDIKTTWIPTGTTANPDKAVDRPMSGQILTGLRTWTRSSLVRPTLVVKSDFRLTDATRAADAASLLLLRLDRLFK